MSIRRTATIAATTALLGAGLLAAPAAQATETQSPAAPARFVSQSSADQNVVPGSEEYHSWYWTYEACHNAGIRLTAQPSRWKSYDCRDHSSGVTVLLYVYR
ncbi:hypothetical protein GCM10018779_62630 [Streptomyces griseocarneus]|nr:hypothetical protein GCM10018779_62630 [Streptomyces griseocarneus]